MCVVCSSWCNCSQQFVDCVRDHFCTMRLVLDLQDSSGACKWKTKHNPLTRAPSQILQNRMPNSFEWHYFMDFWLRLVSLSSENNQKNCSRLPCVALS